MERLKSADFHIDAPTIVALGNFDGVHKGHTALIKAAADFAALYDSKLGLAVFAFTPHPAYILGGGGKTVHSDDERAFLFDSLGVDFSIEFPCDMAALDMTPPAFIEDVLKTRANAVAVAVGTGYKFGRRREGSAEDFRLSGLRVCEVAPIEYNREKISSTDIRGFITRGDLTAAYELLGRRYFAGGIVIPGKRLGAAMGFPTANILPGENKILPPDGVYATKTLVNGVWFAGVTNVGKNPTVNGESRTVETYLLDFDSDIYGEWIVTEFFGFLRGERKFESVNELKAAIADNAAEARGFFGSGSLATSSWARHHS